MTHRHRATVGGLVPALRRRLESLGAPADPGPALPGRLRPGWATATVVGALALVPLGRHALGWDMLWLGPPAAAALLAFARWSGLSWDELGLSRSTLPRGALWGAGAAAVVGGVYLVGVLVPVTRTAFVDTRYQGSPLEALATALVVIPLGTVLFEEVAFRSVLWAFLARHAPTWQVMAATSGLFGLWHVLPALDSTANQAVATLGDEPAARVGIVLGTVVLTTLGGLVFAELRRRTGSLWAPVGLHWATNGLGVLFGALATRLD